MGDYNINLLNVDSHSLTADFNDTMCSFGLVPLITRPTRVAENSATLIDNIFTNKGVSYDESVCGILVTDISDHYPIFCVDKILKHKTIDVSFVRRDYSEKNKSSFLNNLAPMNWQGVYSDVYSTGNTQCAFSLFHEKWLIFMTSIFLGWLLVFERQFKRINYRNWWELRKTIPSWPNHGKKNISRKLWSIIKNIINRNKSKFQEKFKLNDDHIQLIWK